MADLMRTVGVGSRCSILALAVVMLGGASACLTGETGAPSEVVTSGQRASGSRQQREQVVQKIVGTGSGQGVVAEGRVAVEPRPAGESQASASAAGVSRASSDALAPRANAADTITSKHLEAELNRLEAELAN